MNELNEWVVFRTVRTTQTFVDGPPKEESVVTIPRPAGILAVLAAIGAFGSFLVNAINLLRALTA